MQVHIEEVSPVEKRLAIEVPWDRVREKLERAYRELGHQVQMNGFRKGKVPRSVLERRFGKSVQKEVASELVRETFVQAAIEHKLEPVSDPVVEDMSFEPQVGLKFSARVEVRGKVELAQVDGLAGRRRKVEVAEDEVDRALEHKRQQHVEFRPIEGRTATADTDVVIAQVSGKVGDIDVDKEVQVDLGDARSEPLPGLAAALVGLPLDAKNHPVSLAFAEDAPQKEIAGKTAQLKVTFRDARRKVVPNLDDDFAKDTGEADNLAELRQKTREMLEKAAQGRAERDMREGLLKELVKANPVAVAPSLVERGIDSQIQRARLSFAMQGVDLDKTGIDMKAMRDKLRDGAADEVRSQLLLDAVADREGISVSDADLDAKIAELAAAQGKRPGKVKAEMDKEGSLDTLRWRLRQEKALDLVASRATITEVTDADLPAAATEGEAQP
ncbi:MAG TPA: trigger factor [Haliangiales bacterium]|nr:trigger factor [Haliangiales bacterium]